MDEKIKHCGFWFAPAARYELFPARGTRGLIRQIALAFHCSSCKNWLYRYYDDRQDGIKSLLKKIHRDDWVQKWMPRFDTEMFDPGTVVYKKISLKVGQYTNTVKRPADRNISYLRQLKAI